MATEKNKSSVIELVNVDNFPRITQNGYYPVIITQAQFENPKTNRCSLWIKFEVREGPSKGAMLSRRFYRTEKSIRSLSYLCKAVGITGKLENPQIMIGKKLIALVNMKKHNKRGSLIPEPSQFVPSDETKEDHYGYY